MTIVNKNRTTEETLAELLDEINGAVNVGWTLRGIAKELDVSYSSLWEWRAKKKAPRHTQALILAMKYIRYNRSVVISKKRTS